MSLQTCRYKTQIQNFFKAWFIKKAIKFQFLNKFATILRNTATSKTTIFSYALMKNKSVKRQKGES